MRLQQIRDGPHRRVPWPVDVWQEVCMATLLLPVTQMDLGAPFCERVEITDASLTGFGRAWARLPEDVVADICRLSDSRGIYTNLSFDTGVALSEVGRCALEKVRWPLDDVKWTTLGAPATRSHIGLGEADAANWSLEARLHRPTECGCRVLHGEDSASTVGAFNKGRSSSYRLNRRCRRRAAIVLAGGLEDFHGWLSTDVNPADEPSRRWEPLHRRKSSPLPSHNNAAVTGIPQTPCTWSRGEFLFLHLCSGPRRPGDICEHVERRGLESGLVIQTVALDPVVHTGLDLLDGALRESLRKQASVQRIMGAHAGPPCSTVSRARHRALPGGGPRPLRRRAQFWDCIEGRSSAERQACLVGSTLMLICLGLLGDVARGGGWIGLEHPDDPGCEPYPSLFATQELQALCQYAGLITVRLHQCAFGASSKKPTRLVLSDFQTWRLQKSCPHNHKHAPLIGRAADGGFKTTPAAKYPPLLCDEIAALAVESLVYGRAAGLRLGFAARGAWTWPEPRTGFLTKALGQLRPLALSGGTRGPQM
jgi:hypothetical protein